MRKVVIYYHTRNLSTIRKIQEHFNFPKKMTVNGETLFTRSTLSKAKKFANKYYQKKG